MKKYLIAAVALLGFSSAAMAIDYEPEEGFTFQANVGMSVSSISGLEDYGSKAGFTIGAKGEYMLPSAMGVYVNAGVDWTMKGAKHEWDEHFSIPTVVDATYSITNTISTHYIQIPIHVGFRYNLAENLGLYGEFGPYFAFGLAGSSKNSLDADGTWTKQYETSYGIFTNKTKTFTFQRPDFGVGIRIGAEYDNHYSINAGMDWGVTDMYRDKYRDYIYDTNHIELDPLHNFCFTIGVGYRF